MSGARSTRSWPRSKRRWHEWPAVGLAVLFVPGILIPLALLSATGGHSDASGPVRVARPVRVQVVRVPNLVGLMACTAERTARDAGLGVRHVPQSRCDALVISQRPAPGKAVRRHGTLTLRLRG